MANYPSNLGGPLTASINKNSHREYRKIHLYTTFGRSVCCLMTYNPNKTDMLTDEDWANLDIDASMCVLCHHKVSTPEQVENQESDKDTDSELEGSDNDTDSDMDCHEM